jgi:hypothetical protein
MNWRQKLFGGREGPKTTVSPAPPTPAKSAVPAEDAAAFKPITNNKESTVSEILTEQEINIDRLEGLFKAAFFRAERDKDGDLVIRDEQGVNTFVKVDADKKMITFYSLWGLKSRFPEAAKLKFANELNDGLILVRFGVPHPNILWCDYQFLYEGGIAPFHIINTYRRFVNVCKGAVQRDKDDMIGRD